MTKLNEQTLREKLAQRLSAIPQHRPDADEVLGLELGQELKLIPIELIDPCPWQARIQFRPEDIDTLAEDIRTNGLNQPVSVRKKEDGRYELIAGERRWRAVKQIGEAGIQAIVRHVNNQQAAQISIAENLLRENLSDFEVALAFKRLEEEGLVRSKQEIVRISGYQTSDVYRFFSFFALPKKIIDRLHEKPDLINRVAAEQLVSLKRQYANIDALLNDAVTQCATGKVPASKISVWILSKLNQTGIEPHSKQKTFYIDGKKSALVKQTKNQWQIKFSEETTLQEFSDFVQKFFEEKAMIEK